jgi:hypothetical protein
MKERLEQLKKLLFELKSDSYSDQYAIADFIQGDGKNEKAIQQLSAESELYLKLITKIDAFKSTYHV